MTIVICVILLVLYLMQSAGLYMMAENANIENSWYAFVPALQYYIVGRLIEEMRIGDFYIPYLEWVLVPLPVLVFCSYWIPTFRWILVPLGLFFHAYVMYCLFSKYTSQAARYTLISLLTGFLVTPYFIFILGNTPPIDGSWSFKYDNKF